MKIKLLTRVLTSRVEPEIYTTPTKKDATGNPVTIGRIVNITTRADGKRVLEIEIDDRNKNRFKDVANPNPKDDNDVTEWAELHFDNWHKRRLLLPLKKR
ncbi:hypothetical protein MLDJOKPK_00225 [Salmonella phage SPAsTU]|nr:hypothetical protein STsAS_185 [Salmonella phage STsAS]AWN09132.1 hypothetical protein MLDJOKPK_00225 [Salmonella phage SPAsTU]